MEITLLPENKIAVSKNNRSGKKFTEIKMLGELSLALLNFDFEPLFNKAFELSKRLAALRPSKNITSSALEYARAVNAFITDFDCLKNEASTTPFADMFNVVGIRPHLESLRIEDAENYTTVENAVSDLSHDDRIAFTDDEYFDSTYEIFAYPWIRTYESLAIFRELYEILIYSRDKNLAERIQAYGLENFNGKIRKASSVDLNYSVTKYEGKIIFTESYSVNPSELLVLEYVKMIQADISVKHCLNCGKLFALYSGHKNNYCSSIPSGETQACAVIGPIRQFKKKTKNDPLLQMFDKVKKRISARATRNGISYKFGDWSQLATTIRDEALAARISPEELEKRLEAASNKVGI